MLFIFSFLSVPRLLFGLWVLARSLARLLSGEVTPQRPGQPLLALLWYFLLTRGLCSWAFCPSVGQACEKDRDVIPFSRVEAGAGLGVGRGARVGGGSLLLTYGHGVHQLSTTSTQYP